jgi:hypothetical protein
MRSSGLSFPAFAVLSSCLWAGAPDGAALYKDRCGTCHDNAQSQLRMPKREEIAARTPEAVMNAMFSGAMQAALLSEDERRAIALYVTGKTFGGVTETMAGQCTTPPKKFAPNPSADWNGWGVDPSNSRFQPHPGPIRRGRSQAQAQMGVRIPW